jgi:hypothetical protein
VAAEKVAVDAEGEVSLAVAPAAATVDDEHLCLVFFFRGLVVCKEWSGRGDVFSEGGR